jgi:PAS domain S-box-containing protein
LLNDQGLLLKKLANVFDSARDGLWYMGLDDSVCFYNSNFYKQFDIPLDNSKLDDWIKLIHPMDLNKFKNKLKVHKYGNIERVETQYRVLTKKGIYIWIDAVGIIVSDPDETYMVGCHKDVSEQKKMEDELNYLAFYDLTTGLANKKGWLKDIKSEPEKLNIVISINNSNTYQRCWGEKAIVKFVEVIDGFCKRNILKNYRVYRVKDDILVIRMQNNPANSDGIMNGLENIFNLDFHSRNVMSFHDVSIGVFSDSSIGEDSHFNVLLKVVDYAKFYKKLTKYDGDVINDIDRMFILKDSIKQAIYNDDFFCEFQPIICSNSKRVVSFEALARWEHNTIGSVSPDEFLPAIEELGLISEFGRNIFKKSISFISEFNETFDVNINININISVLQLSENDIIDKLSDLVKYYSVDNDKVIIEVTESHILDHQSMSVEQLNKARDEGFKVSLDDFGSGYSSLIGLFRLDIDQLKIDKSLVHDSMHIPSCLAMFQHLIKHCQDNKIDLVAEGVETDDMSEFLNQLGVSFLQGYLFSVPKQRDYWFSHFVSVHQAPIDRKSVTLST